MHEPKAVPPGAQAGLRGDGTHGVREMGVSGRNGISITGRRGRRSDVVGRGACLLAMILAGTRAAPASDSDCATMVPLEDVVRGKGAFYSQCETLSESTNLGGCWTQAENTETAGCQTCYIAEAAFETTVFPVFFATELDPCPTTMDYATFYKDLHGSLSLVTASAVTSTGCPDGWLYSADTDHCYFKSLNTAKAADEADAETKCAAEGAWLIAIESQEENDFLLQNMLWIGFFGETYTGMVKDTPDGEWGWPAEAVGGGAASDYSCLTGYSDWLEGATIGCASSYNDGAEEKSCMEIYPYEPKGWNPFSCLVGKHFVCEMEATGGTVGTGETSTPAPSDVLGETMAPTSNITVAGTPAPGMAPTVVTTASPTVTTPSPVAVTVSPSKSPAVTDQPVVAPTVEPTMAVTVAPSVAGDGSRGAESSAPSAVPTSEPEETTSTPAPADIDSELWEGDSAFSVTKQGSWGPATYSIYLVDGDEESPVAEDVPKLDVGTENDEYSVRSGCYRLQVTSGSDPTAFTWEVSGGDRSGGENVSSGQGLDGGLFSVAGGVCGIGSCQTSCLADYFDSTTTSETVTTCDGFKALVDGQCAEVCTAEEGEDIRVFQQECVRAGCNPETECGVTVVEGTLGTEYTLSVKALLEVTGLTEASSSGGGQPALEFESSVAAWLGVEISEVTVTAVNGVDISEDPAEQGRRLRAGQRRRLSRSAWDWVLRRMQSSASESSSGYTRYTVSVHPVNSTESGVIALETTAADANGSVALETWMREEGGTWETASVRELTAEAITTPYLIGEFADDAFASSGEWYEENPVAIGSIAAVTVVVLGVLLIACFVRRTMKKRSRLSALRS